MSQDSPEDNVMIKVVVSREMRDQFKGQCALNGSNMNSVLAEFIETYVKNQGAIQTIPKSSS